MNRKHAREIAETITNEQLQKMFDTAKERITDWKKVSNVNKGMTKGTSWNVLAKDFDVNEKYHILAKTNMIREFGEYLPENLQPTKKGKIRSSKPPTHQDPIF